MALTLMPAWRAWRLAANISSAGLPPSLLRVHVVTLDKLLRSVLIAKVRLFRKQILPVLLCSLLQVMPCIRCRGCAAGVMV